MNHAFAKLVVAWFAYGPSHENLVLIACKATKDQARLRIRADSPDPSLLAYTKYGWVSMKVQTKV